ncbi:uncharacterized protein C8R40DRAFT_1022348, partial [Lentinula edodes]|uniref:uncharacterized protein n=1 Tax=Lentinula edodes TaxID=5353 RepID=UPI001E8DB2F8
VTFVISSINLTFLSYTISSHSMLLDEVQSPNVYIGLERVPSNALHCRRRVTFPRSFWTYSLDEPAALTKIHAPDDKSFLTFGASVDSYVEIYVADYGLENCTISAQFLPRDGFTDSNVHLVDLYLLDGPRFKSTHRTFLGSLLTSPGAITATPPFYCPSHTLLFFEWKCPHPDCIIGFPLEGVTAMTASAASLNKSGFQMNQYESTECI